MMQNDIVKMQAMLPQAESCCQKVEASLTYLIQTMKKE